MHEKVFKELSDYPGKEILQVEGIKQACDEDIQEIFKRDVETENKRLQECLNLIKKDHLEVDIENFKDWEQIGYYKQTIPVKLCSLEQQEKPKDDGLILTKNDVEKNHFDTLLPYGQDYTGERVE